MYATTCGGPFFGPYDFDTQISVYRGTCLSPLVLPEATSCNDDVDWCGLHSQVEWYAVDGVDYLVLVHGFSLEGRFRLRFTYNIPNALGERCTVGDDCNFPNSPLLECDEGYCIGLDIRN